MRRPVVANWLGEIPCFFPAGREPNKPGASDRVARRRWLPSDRRPIPAADIAIAVAAGHWLPLSPPRSGRPPHADRRPPHARRTRRRSLSLARGRRRTARAPVGRRADGGNLAAVRLGALRSRSRRLDRPVRSARPNSRHYTARRRHLQLLAGRSQPEGPLAPHDPRVLPRSRSELGGAARSRRARQGGRRGLDLGGRLDAAASPRSSHSAFVAWRRRRGGAARVRHSLEAFRRRRIWPARSEGWRLLARSRHAAGFQRSRRGNGDAVRLRPNRPALATRRGFREGRHPVRDPIREIVRRWLARSHLYREAIGLHGSSQLFRT